MGFIVQNQGIIKGHQLFVFIHRNVTLHRGHFVVEVEGLHGGRGHNVLVRVVCLIGWVYGVVLGLGDDEGILRAADARYFFFLRFMTGR